VILRQAPRQGPFPVSAVLTQRQACAIVLFTIEYRRIKAVNRTSRHTSEASESQPICCEVGASANAEWTGEPQVESGLSRCSAYEQTLSLVDCAGDATVIKAEGIGSASREVAPGVLPMSCPPVPATSETGLRWSNRGGTTGGHRTLVPCPGRGFFYSRRATLPPDCGLSTADCGLAACITENPQSKISNPHYDRPATSRPQGPSHPWREKCLAECLQPTV